MANFTEEQYRLLKKIEDDVRIYMAPYDASHDFTHIERVLDNTQQLLRAERAAHPEIQYDGFTVVLAALIHDVGDHKYPKPGQTDEDRKVAGEKLLIANGVDPSLAKVVQAIGNAVSYTNECRDPEYVRQMIIRHPELAIVQDADRLDALGPVGVGRAFTYNGSKPRDGGTMQSAITHVRAKLVQLPGMMKTEEGRAMAGPLWEQVRDFLEKWEKQVHRTGDETKRIDWEGGVYS